MENPGFYAVIPADVRYSDIEANAKLLYGEITALSNKQGYCFATNKYFGELYRVDVRTIQRWINSLIENGFIFSDLENNYTRKLYLCKVGQKCQGGMTKMSGGYDKNVTIYNNTNNTTSNTSSSVSSEEIIKEEEEEDIFICDLSEFKKFINEGKLKTEFPWKNFEASISDCFLYYEEKGKRIKKQNAQLVASKWFSGGDPKKREEEKNAWEEDRKKVKYDPTYDPANIEIERNKKMKLQGMEFLKQNPNINARLDVLAYEKALDIAKGNEKIAMSLKTGILYRMGYDESMNKTIDIKYR